jgi:transposase
VASRRNVLLLALPPYSPELDPMERVWEYIKDDIAWELFRELFELSDRLYAIIQAFYHLVR